MALEILPFSDEHLDAAAALLRDSHARHRSTEPLLGDVDDFRAQVERQCARERASGVVALRDGAPAGYLVGAEASSDNRGGTRIFTDIAGHATAEPEFARDLFAAAADRWHEEGQDRFAVVVPAHDAGLVDAWFRVGFGLQFAYGVRESSREAPVDAGVEIRPGTSDDLPQLARFDRELWSHQARSPSFSGLDAFEDDWREDTFDSPDTFWPFLAERDGEVIGEALAVPAPDRRPARAGAERRPRPRCDRSGGARLGGRRRADRLRDRLGLRAGFPLDHDRLA